MHTFPELTASTITTDKFWENLYLYVSQYLPVVNWKSVFTLYFWKTAQNIINLYFYIGIVSCPISFLWGFFGTVYDEKRVRAAFEAIFKISLLIIPISLAAIFLVINGYQALIKGLNSGAN